MLRKLLLIFFLVLLFPCSVLASSGVEYNLPYPGILPDSPFYVIKVARDNIVGFFIRDQKQKVFYSLFLSDKRLAAGEVLMKRKNTELGVTTILKAQEYYAWAVNEAVKSKDNDLVSKLVVAGVKREDVLNSFSANEKIQKALLNNQRDKNRVLELIQVK